MSFLGWGLGHFLITCVVHRWCNHILSVQDWLCHVSSSPLPPTPQSLQRRKGHSQSPKLSVFLPARGNSSNPEAKGLWVRPGFLSCLCQILALWLLAVTPLLVPKASICPTLESCHSNRDDVDEMLRRAPGTMSAQ
jgi:hypothetical protein